MLLSELSDASKQLLENLLVDGDKEVVDFEKLGYSTGKKPKRKKRIAMTRD